MPLKTIPFDGSEFLDDAESQAELMVDALETGDAKYIAHALSVIARARGMTSIAEEAGVTRPALYEALSDDTDPDLAVLLHVAKGLSLSSPSSRAPGTGRPSRRQNSQATF